MSRRAVALQLIEQLLLFLVISFSLWAAGIRCCEAGRQEACRVAGYRDPNLQQHINQVVVSRVSVWVSLKIPITLKYISPRGLSESTTITINTRTVVIKRVTRTPIFLFYSLII